MPTQKQEEYMNRATGLLVIEVINSNPNGDPDKESDPRQRDDQRGEISPVSFKRKIRDLIDDKNGPVWIDVSKKFNPPLDPNKFEIFEIRYRDRALITEELRSDGGKAFKEKYWDGRIFGNTFLEKEENDKEESKDGSSKSEKGKKTEKKENLQKKTIKTGVVQFGLGISVAPIRIQRLTTTSKAGVEKGKEQGMAPLGYRIVEHGIYCIPYFVNSSAARETDCKQNDIELLLKVIPRAYTQTASYVRCQVEILHAWHIEHKSRLGSCSDFDLIKALTPWKTEDPKNEKPSSARADYTIPIEKDIPEELRKKVLSVRDLMTEI